MKQMTFRQMLNHVVDHPDHHAPVAIWQNGFLNLKRWHKQQHNSGVMNHDETDS